MHNQPFNEHASTQKPDTIVKTTTNLPSYFAKQKFSKGPSVAIYSALKVKPERRHVVKREVLGSDRPGWSPDPAFIYQLYPANFYTVLATSKTLCGSISTTRQLDGQVTRFHPNLPSQKLWGWGLATCALTRPRVANIIIVLKPF